MFPEALKKRNEDRLGLRLFPVQVLLYCQTFILIVKKPGGHGNAWLGFDFNHDRAYLEAFRRNAFKGDFPGGAYGGLAVRGADGLGKPKL
ncbi:MAG TPA: hypothetical protein VJ385_04795 [Fibrobacteria bacterium]|nr:hypothetical protein [Fibrobacteria bacterium]